jgi:hypothetical protein
VWEGWPGTIQGSGLGQQHWQPTHERVAAASSLGLVRNHSVQRGRCTHQRYCTSMGSSGEGQLLRVECLDVGLGWGQAVCCLDLAGRLWGVAAPQNRLLSVGGAALAPQQCTKLGRQPRSECPPFQTLQCPMAECRDPGAHGRRQGPILCFLVACQPQSCALCAKCQVEACEEGPLRVQPWRPLSSRPPRSIARSWSR